MASGVSFDYSGPILKNTAGKTVDRFIDRASDTLAKEGVVLVKQELGRVLRHPTGYYKSRIRVTNASGRFQVTDSRVVYGPWLEGVGRRNKSSRFKGYHTFRRMAQQLERQALKTVQGDVNQLTKELGA